MNRLLWVILSLSLFSFISKEKKFSKQNNYVFIPSGKFHDGENEESINAFWMAQHEVTNAEYRFFLQDLKEKGETEKYNLALPDTTQWKSQASFYNYPYAEHYFRHPAYNAYPVVNISREGAELYCEYLTEQYKKLYGNQITHFRLPKRVEWMYAASAGDEYAIYPWGGPNVRNEKGYYMANFRRVNECNVRMTTEGLKVVEDSLKFEVLSEDQFSNIIATSVSYEPNDFGLYNTCGNVAELVDEEGIAVGGDWHLPGYDIRIKSTQQFSGPCPFVGFRPVMSFLKD